MTARAHDVVVIGGGPAGTTVATQLASAGHDVLVLEEHGEIGAPVHCTGLLGFEAFEEFNLPRQLILAEAGSARFWGASGQSVPVVSRRVGAAVIDRRALDQFLAQRARHAGAEVVTGVRAERVSVDGARVRVSIGGGASVDARACVLACGANYRFHRPFGLGLPRVYLQSAQVEARFPNADEIEIRFGRGVAPSGFAWMVPFARDGESFARIGLMSDARSREHFLAFRDVLATRVGANPADVPAPRLKMLPLGPVQRTYADRLLAVGDAAGLVKPTTGGGIYYGMISGALAADVLDESLRRDRLGAQALARYDVAWRRRLGQEIRVGLEFRRIASRLSDGSINELIDLARVDGLIPLLERTASFNWHRKAAIALLGYPAFRRIVFKSWTQRAGAI